VSDEGSDDFQEEKTADLGDELKGVNSDEDEDSVSADDDPKVDEGENKERTRQT